MLSRLKETNLEQVPACLGRFATWRKRKGLFGLLAKLLRFKYELFFSVSVSPLQHKTVQFARLLSGLPCWVDCLAPRWKMALSGFLNALPHRKSNQGFATFLLIAFRFTCWHARWTSGNMIIDRLKFGVLFLSVQN